MRKLLLPLLLTACTPPSPATPDPVQIPTAQPNPADPQAAPKPTWSVTPVAVPAKPAVDGDLAEWGALPGDAAGSRLVFALHGEGLRVAAELSASSREGIWLGVGARAPEVPRIGEAGRAGNVEELDCEHERTFMDGGYVPTEKKLSPEDAAACKALLAAHAKFGADHAARFSARFRVDREGVRRLGEDGQLAPVAGAKIAWKVGEKSAAVEVSLPPGALPRMSEAPVASLAVWAGPASGAIDPSPAEDAHKRLPAPVSFEPHGEIRAGVYAWIQKGMPGGYGFGDVHQPELGFSYQPGDPEHVETLRYAGLTSVTPTQETLYEKREALGELEIGYAHGFTDFLVVSRKGKVLSFVQLDIGCWDGTEHLSCGFAAERGMVRRDGEIHVFGSYPGASHTRNMGTYGEHAGAWFIIGVSADGKVREIQPVPVGKQEEGGVRSGAPPAMWSYGAAAADKAMEQLTWRGVRWTDGNGAATGVESRLRWEPAQKRYTLSWQRFPLPKEKPARKAKRK